MNWSEMTVKENEAPGSAPETKVRAPSVSIIIPMLNERTGLNVLFQRLKKAIEPICARWEIIAVDDGSSDGTKEILSDELKVFSNWKAVILARNFGQQAAYKAGLEYADSDAVVFLDADLQDPPEVIPQLVEEWKKGFKVVTACRKSREERGIRRWMFDLFHLLFSRMTNQTMPPNSGMFSLVDRVVVQKLKQVKETSLFLPALKCWFGFPQATVLYARQQRAVGEPKQSFRKLLNYALNGVFSFSELPLQWIAVIGVLISLTSFAYAAFLVCIKICQLFGWFLSYQVKGFTTLAVAVFCLGGIQLLCLGIIGQYLARIYREIKNRPVYVIEKVLQSNES